MRKSLLERDPAQPGFQSDKDWLDVEKLATLQARTLGTAEPMIRALEKLDSVGKQSAAYGGE